MNIGEEEKINENFPNLDNSPALFWGTDDLDNVAASGDDLDNAVASSDDEDVFSSAASTLNPNKDDERRLFQVRNVKFTQDPTKPYDEQPKRLITEGPTPLLQPDHWYDCEGGIVVIHWQKDRSTATTCCIKSISEDDETFVVRVYDYHGKSKRTFFDSGKDLTAKQSDVWRMTHRLEFEREICAANIHKGQVLRVELKRILFDCTGIVRACGTDFFTLTHTTGNREHESTRIRKEDVTKATEILSFPLFYKIRQTVKGTQGSGTGTDIKWVQEEYKGDKVRYELPEVKPRLLLKVPPGEKYKRVWHFIQLFPIEELEYCCNVAIQEKYEEGVVPEFDAIAFFAAWFASRNFRVGSKDGYRKDLKQKNLTRYGQAFSKLPQDTYEAWHSTFRGCLPLDREYFMGSILGARDREYGVCRLKTKLLENSRNAREAPLTFVCDEQINPYTGHISGAKKRLPKKTCEGLEYYTLATTNKDYEGYSQAIRAPLKEGEVEQEIISKADPVCGGYTLAYEMDSGPRYETGFTAPSKIFGRMILLISLC